MRKRSTAGKTNAPLVDLSALPSQPEDLKFTPNAIPAEPEEQPEPQVVAAVWDTITDEQKDVHLQSLIVACVDNIYRNNPVLWIWVPIGSKEEVTKIWVDRMTKQLGGSLDPTSATTQLYFPDVKEDPAVAVPSLYTQELKIGNDLLQFTRELASFAEVDINNIHTQVGLDIPSMKGLLLFWNIGMPAMLKKLQQLQETSAGPKVSKGGILLPG